MKAPKGFWLESGGSKASSKRRRIPSPNRLSFPIKALRLSVWTVFDGDEPITTFRSSGLQTAIFAFQQTKSFPVLYGASQPEVGFLAMAKILDKASLYESGRKDTL